METLGAKECQSGSKVLEESKCLDACKELNIEVDTSVRKDGRTCFSSNRQKCRMQVNLPSGGKFRLICKRSGDLKYC